MTREVSHLSHLPLQTGSWEHFLAPFPPALLILRDTLLSPIASSPSRLHVTLSRTSDDHSTKHQAPSSRQQAAGTMSTSSSRRKVARLDLNTPIATCYPEGCTSGPPVIHDFGDLLNLPGKKPYEDDDLKTRESFGDWMEKPFFRVEVGGRFFNVPSGLLRDYPYWSSLLYGNWKESVTDTRVIEGIPADVFGLALEMVVRRGLLHDDELRKLDLPTLFAVVRVFDRFAMDRMIGPTLNIVNKSLDIRWYATGGPDFNPDGEARSGFALDTSVRRAAEINNAFEIGRPAACLSQHVKGDFFAMHFLLNIPRRHYDATLPKVCHELLVEINKLMADMGGARMLHKNWSDMRGIAHARTAPDHSHLDNVNDDASSVASSRSTLSETRCMLKTVTPFPTTHVYLLDFLR
ncbi:hypothetical protein SODALDRAFT_331544 [Sodiomyces alkalinus F11]|uniref:BTB domain-containing protein n=1 Tax=Sodiomyces alkalinus (strain CBS 110278 / VKM F-3762 / F11) TaxID=1314773 RepID=A0A3N2Q4S9_SODAK|nr:hypothetical protein SODALDRAFT_331544 [Sodiomyces alkalinus F11]ROT41762.1 hypothetical protein SODALDRAFT_331544 [Sodiomyces alkalinus F11]